MATTAYVHEQEVKDLVERVFGLQCDVALGQPHRYEFDANAGNPQGEIEIDFLVPFHNICVVGEHTDAKSRKNVKQHLARLADKISFLQSLPTESRFAPFHMPLQKRKAYKAIKQVSGCLIYSNESVGKPIKSTYPHIVALSQQEWELVQHYGECLGSDGKYHFLDAIGIPIHEIAGHSSSGKSEARIIRKSEYLHLGKRALAESFPEADVFIFAIEPSTLVPISRVLRRDNLPTLVDPMNPDRTPRYQRVLIAKKLVDLRKLISGLGATFAFPTAVLALLSSDCHLDSTDESLILPKQFGALEIIDGQHRLFAYATSDVPDAIKEESRLVVIAVRFSDDDREQAPTWAARMFVDINTKQTRVRRDLQLIIAFESGQQQPEHLAAGMLLKVNDTGPLENRLYVGATSPRDSIPINTIITRLKPLFDLKKLRKLKGAAKRKRLKLLDVKEDVFDEGREMEYVDAMAACFRTFFVKISQQFCEDWSSPNESALLSAKYFAAFTDCLRSFIEKGQSWNDVEKWLKRVKSRSLKSSKKAFRDKGVAFGSPGIPSRKSPLREIVDHLQACGQWRRKPKRKP